MQPENNNPPITPSEPTISTPPVSAEPAQPFTPTATGTVFGVNGLANQQKVKAANKKKFVLIGGVITAVILLGGGGAAGAYFGFIMPNQPDNVWKHGLTNTNLAYDKLAQANQNRADKKGGTFKGNFKYDTKTIAADGTIDAKFYDKNTVAKIDAGASGTRFTMDLLSTVPENASNPDIYVRVGGLKGIDKVLGASAAGTGDALAAYDNQWYVIDHTLLDETEKKASNDGQAMPNLSQQDINAITDAVGKVNHDYLFTTDETKAVLTKTQNVGKEQFDGRDAYHFKVGYKKDKLKAYVAAMNTELQKTKLKTYVTSDTIKEINDNIDKLDDTQQADAWVDMQTKLIRDVRIVVNQKNGDTLDIGQKYNGGNEVPFAVSYASKQKGKEGTLNLLVTGNLKSDDVKISANVNATQDNTKFTFNGTFTAGNDKVTVDKPAGAKSLLELYSQFAPSAAAGEQQMLGDTSSL